ncbi:MAG TPA: glycerophosphodiester phosphodiesterase family protein [Halomonas sp.]|nr:glycerophosphodiester phosphodiesterase family protein [Halomonas sp.]
MSAPPAAKLTPGALARSVLRALRDQLRPLIAYHLFFTLLASSLLLPAIAWTLAHVLKRFGRPVLTLNELLELALSPAGSLWLLLTIALTFLVLYLQQAGMMLLAVRRRDGRFRSAFVVLWHVVHRLPALLGLIIAQVGTHLLLALPVALALGGLYELMLGGLDSYYVQKVRPPALWYYLTLAVPLIAAWAIAAARLYVRWILALPIVVLEQYSALPALRLSYRLTRRRTRALGLMVLTLLAIIAALPVAASALFDALLTPLLGWLPDDHDLLAPIILGYVTLYMLLTLAITFVGIAANALLSASLYLRLGQRQPHLAPSPPPAQASRLAWALELGVLLFAVSQAWWIVNSFELRDDVTIIAHRGSSQSAPENTLAAVKQAVADGADYVEIDVRLSADDRLVLYHDRSLRRLLGDPRNIADIPFDELRRFDAGSWFGDAFVGEPIATLGEALAATRGRAGLMIDMKSAAGQEATLIEAVLGALDAETAQRRACRDTLEAPYSVAHCGAPEVYDDVRLAVGRPWLVDALKQREPRLRITLLAELIVPGTLERRGFDALGLRYNRINEKEIRLANHYGYELHAWTVNAPREMTRLMDLGVDAIITDHPRRLVALVEQRAALSDGELLLVKLRSWLRD